MMHVRASRDEDLGAEKASGEEEEDRRLARGSAADRVPKGRALSTLRFLALFEQPARLDNVRAVVRALATFPRQRAPCAAAPCAHVFSPHVATELGGQLPLGYHIM